MKAISLPLVLYQEFAKLIPQSILGLPDDSILNSNNFGIFEIEMPKLLGLCI